MLAQLFQKNTHYLDRYQLWHETMTILLAEQILNNRHLFETFVEQLSHNVGVMDYIIAEFQFYDLVNTDWYMRGIRIFCNNSKRINHKLYVESIEYFAMILNQRQDEGHNVIKRMNALIPQVRKREGFIFPLEGAVYGCLIADAAFNNNVQTKQLLLNEALDILKNNKKEKFVVNQYFSINNFLLNMIEVLTLSGLYEEVFYFISNFEFKTNSNFFFKLSEMILFNTIKAMVLVKVGEKEKAKEVFNTIKFEEKYIRFDRKTISKLNYLVLSFALSSKRALVKRKAIKAEIEKLANKTGMYIFKSKIAEFE